MLKFIILFFTLSISLVAGNLFSAKQIKNLQTVYSVSSKITKYPSTIASIALVESSAGKNIIGDWNKNSGTSLLVASLGILQIRLNTCKWVIKKEKSLYKYSKYNDSKLAGLLLTDIKFSTIIASYYFEILRKSRHQYFPTISGYNGGYYNRPYYDRVIKAKKHISSLKKAGYFK